MDIKTKRVWQTYVYHFKQTVYVHYIFLDQELVHFLTQAHLFVRTDLGAGRGGEKKPDNTAPTAFLEKSKLKKNQSFIITVNIIIYIKLVF